MTDPRNDEHPLWLQDEGIENVTLGSQYSDEDLKTLAKEIVTGFIFTSDMVRNTKDLHHVFLPTVFLDERMSLDMEASNVTLFFEEIKLAGPRSINGYPTFFSMKMMNKDKHIKLVEYIKQVQLALDNI